MANKLDPMDLKQIITLHLDGLSNRKIGKTLGISRNTVNQYMGLFKGSQLSFKALLELDNAALEELFTTATTLDHTRYNQLVEYFDKMQDARHHPGFTFRFHYYEYRASCKHPYSYTQFMEHYNRKYPKQQGSMKLEHEAGHEIFVDFAGKKLHIIERETGEEIPVEVFVGILPFSQYTYVEACQSQKREDFLKCMGNTLSYYGGVPKAIISDNLKAAVKRASKYEPDINRSFKEFAQHYNCVVNPTRSYSPQDKALVENAVYLVYQRIYYPIRNMQFFSLAALNTEIKRLLAIYNNLLFQRKQSSRKELFQSIERSYLKPLPLSNYQIKGYKRIKVQKIGYVYFNEDKNYYSVPYRYIGKHVQIHFTSNMLEIYFYHERIATHKRNFAKGAYTTIKEHLRSTHQQYLDWSPDYFISLAAKHGTATMQLIKELFQYNDYPEVNYKRAMGIIQLHKIYSSERLNKACQRALIGQQLSYKMVKNILDNQLDVEPLDVAELNNDESHIPPHQNIRGASAYQ